MTPEELARVKSAHSEALSLPGADRAGFLQARFAGEPHLLDEVSELIRCSEGAGAFLQTPLIARLIEPDSRDHRPSRIGPYALIRDLGHGGASSVYLARRDDDLFERQVAIKILNRFSHSEDAFARFRREIQTLARVEHPYIVRLLDAGTTEVGVAYIVTEFIDGKDVDQFTAPLPLEEMLRVFLKICEGVSAAHQRLIVHRDIKPSNILVTEEGVPKLLDFGIALLLDSDTRLTDTGLRRMTAHYASPEQLRGDKNISTLSDVFSLGVLLDQLVLTRARTLPFDLRAIIQKARSEEPDRRYASVDHLWDDVTRFLAREPVVAQGHDVRYRARKFLRKHWIAVTAVGAGLCLLAGLAVFSTVAAHMARKQSLRVKDLLTNAFEVTDAHNHRWTGLPVRRSLETVKLFYLEPVSAEYPDDRELQTQRFDSWRELAHVQGLPFELNLGETAQARTSMAKAVAIGENLIRRWPGGPRSRRDVALARLELGAILIEMNLQPEANAEFQRADELSGSASDPDLRVHLEFMAQRSRILRLRGQPSEALELRRQVAEQREAIFRGAPKSILWEYAGSLCSYGELLREMGKFREAAQAYAKALPLIEEWAAVGPEELNRAWHQARENEEYAKALAGMGETEPAIARLDRAIAFYRNILLREPDAMSDQRALAMCLTNCAQLEARRGGSSRALGLIREAERLSEEAVNRDAASWRAQTEFAGIRKAAAEIRR